MRFTHRLIKIRRETPYLQYCDRVGLRTSIYVIVVLQAQIAVLSVNMVLFCSKLDDGGTSAFF